MKAITKHTIKMLKEVGFDRNEFRVRFKSDGEAYVFIRADVEKQIALSSKMYDAGFSIIAWKGELNENNEYDFISITGTPNTPGKIRIKENGRYRSAQEL